MTPHQINLIKSSFAKIYFTRDESAKIFYDRLFAVAPEVRPLFKTDMTSQGKKLMDTLGLAVTALGHPQSLLALVDDTAKRHIQYGVTAAHYEQVRAALLWMMERQLGNDFTPAVKDAWAELYDWIATTMQRVR